MPGRVEQIPYDSSGAFHGAFHQIVIQTIPNLNGYFLGLGRHLEDPHLERMARLLQQGSLRPGTIQRKLQIQPSLNLSIAFETTECGKLLESGIATTQMQLFRTLARSLVIQKSVNPALGMKINTIDFTNDSNALLRTYGLFLTERNKP